MELAFKISSTKPKSSQICCDQREQRHVALIFCILTWEQILVNLMTPEKMLKIATVTLDVESTANESF